MSFRSERKEYISNSNVSIEETDYINNTADNKSCKEIKKTYIKKCDKTTTTQVERSSSSFATAKSQFKCELCELAEGNLGGNLFSIIMIIFT